MPDVVNRLTRTFLEDYLADNSVLREIEAEFSAANIARVEIGDTSLGQRRNLVREFYAGLRWDHPEDISKFVTVASYFLAKEDLLTDQKRALGTQAEITHPLQRFIDQMKKCGFEWRDG
ncbi:hypothetical protein KTQ54_09655 [Komagataeibacter oboediens]|uniref:hypothetical protein n=1 Tax=Komagataeibacter oboediens TaxID=65958 RepID=UPI001C2C3B93|nr:hypothetical protein [Komagataeibacter oboediens]MBV0888802.1 hypothetical protein [Komagataeibacter oboediens]MCK9821761.1 hypothetical protein [Komagataeibacter oboediens]